MIKIDKGIPAPSKSRAIYPLREMDVGDSFFAEGKNSQQISGAFGLHKPKKFVVRAVTEDGVQGLRVWRVK